MKMRVFDLCSRCVYLSEIKRMDPPVEIPVRHGHRCRVTEITTCVRLGRVWPVCKEGQNVFVEDSTCHMFSPGVPQELSFIIVASQHTLTQGNT